jgi:hypothetical protein
MRFLSKSLMLKASIIVLSACLGATAMYAWQASKVDNKPAAAAGSVSTFIRELHKSPHTDKLPVEVIENYN